MECLTIRRTAFLLRRRSHSWVGVRFADLNWASSGWITRYTEPRIARRILAKTVNQLWPPVRHGHVDIGGGDPDRSVVKSFHFGGEKRFQRAAHLHQQGALALGCQ